MSPLQDISRPRMRRVRRFNAGNPYLCDRDYLIDTLGDILRRCQGVRRRPTRSVSRSCRPCAATRCTATAQSAPLAVCRSDPGPSSSNPPVSFADPVLSVPTPHRLLPPWRGAQILNLVAARLELRLERVHGACVGVIARGLLAPVSVAEPLRGHALLHGLTHAELLLQIDYGVERACQLCIHRAVDASGSIDSHARLRSTKSATLRTPQRPSTSPTTGLLGVRRRTRRPCRP